MKTTHSILITLLLFATVSARGQKTTSLPYPAAPEPAAQGRYQLISTHIELNGQTGESLHSQLFLLDTRTGRVWRYQPAGSIQVEGQQAPTSVPEVFIPIEIWKSLEKSKTLPQD